MKLETLAATEARRAKEVGMFFWRLCWAVSAAPLEIETARTVRNKTIRPKRGRSKNQWVTPIQPVSRMSCSKRRGHFEETDRTCIRLFTTLSLDRRIDSFSEKELVMMKISGTFCVTFLCFAGLIVEGRLLRRAVDGNLTRKALVSKKQSFESDVRAGEKDAHDSHAKENDNGRVLMGDHNFFAPSLECLACDKHVAFWSEEAFDPAAGPVVIPCGHCITMDFVPTSSNNNTLVLPFGLDIQGKLFFRWHQYDKSKLTIVTPFILVQGELLMRAHKNAVGSVPNVKILLTDSDSGGLDAPTSFIPAGVNKFACSVDGSSGSPDPCNVGSKPIVVAGGKLDIMGIPTDCSTWVKLYDVPTATTLPKPSSGTFSTLPKADPNHPNMACRRNDVPYIQESFSGAESDSLVDWSAWFDDTSSEETSSGTFFVSNRENKHDGPSLDLGRIRECLIPDQIYLFSARIRLFSNAAKGTPTTCALTGSDCLRLTSAARYDSETVNDRKGGERQSDYSTYGEWHNFHAAFSFGTDELARDNLKFHKLTLAGPAEGVDIEIDDATFTLPPRSVVPDEENVCGGNLLMNGNADVSEIDPYPMESFGPNSRISVHVSEDKNNFFRTDHRTTHRDSVANYLDARGCVVPGARYKISARVRVHSDTMPVEIVITFRTLLKDGSSSKVEVAECPASQSAWVDCTSTFSVVDDFDAENVDSIRFSFETSSGTLHSFDVDDWRLELEEKFLPSLIVPEDGVSGCWGSGAEILVTSHTIDFESSQVRRLVADPEPYAEGLVRLFLDDVIIPPVSEQHGDGFAVEVALLSRNILFEGAVDQNDDLMGGHLIFLHTPAVQQSLQGVEIVNFGQQGNLGRYPIHFHMCAAVDGSQVSKNSIRESNQRCIVIHGTHNLTVAENIAHDTAGHCFITEDGGELDNAFIRNLGAKTRAASRLVREDESDRSNPSTFWMSNPQNTWIGNIAAGSESTGFWFELKTEVQEPTSFMPSSKDMVPKFLPLQLFVDNVAHSNRKHGLRTYPSGWQPPEQVILHNTRSYKNGEAGLFFHNSQDIKVDGGILADNSIQCDFDRADNMEIAGTSVIGTSARYAEIVSSQTGKLAHSEIIGLELHGFARDRANSGTTIRGVNFSRFPGGRLIEVDETKWSGHFDYWTTIEDTQVSDEIYPKMFDFRKAKANGISDIFLTDVDSSLKPFGSSAQGPSSVISNSPQMYAFIEASEKCVNFADYLYCRNTCLRTVTLATSPAETENFVLRVTELGSNKSFDYPGYYSARPHDTIDWANEYRYFPATLPAGAYKAEFILPDSGLSWPTFVEVTFETSQCSPSLDVNESVQLIIPSPSNQHCFQLIRNGDLEDSDSSYPHWLHHGSGRIELLPSAGRGGSNTISGTDYSDPYANLSQFLDTRCIREGNQYDIRAWVKLVNPKDGISFVTCDDGGNNCPSIQLRVRSRDDPEGKSYSEYRTKVASSFVQPFHDSSWNLIQGSVTIDQRMAEAENVAFVIARGSDNVKMLVDDVSMTLIPGSCDDLVFNGNFWSGNSLYWEKNPFSSKESRLMVVNPSGNAALRLMSRSSSRDSIIQNLRTGCMIATERYLAVAKVRLFKPSSNVLQDCNRNEWKGETACPRLQLESFVNADVASQDSISKSIADFDFGIAVDNWYTVSGIFTASKHDEQAVKTVLSVADGFDSMVDVQIDNVSITLLPRDCSQLFLNGSAEDGNTARFWRSALMVGSTTIEVVSVAGSRAFKVSKRDFVGDGLHQSIDTRCLNGGDIFKLTARMKLVSKVDGTPVNCDPEETKTSTGCPPVRITGFENGEKTVDNELFYISNIAAWKSSSPFHYYEVVVGVTPQLAACDQVWVGLRSYNLDWDLIVTDLSLSPE